MRLRRIKQRAQGHKKSGRNSTKALVFIWFHKPQSSCLYFLNLSDKTHLGYLLNERVAGLHPWMADWVSLGPRICMFTGLSPGPSGWHWPTLIRKQKAGAGGQHGHFLMGPGSVILLQLHRASFCFSNSQASFLYEGLCTNCFLLPGKCPFLHLCLANSSLSEFACHLLREALCNYSILPSPCIPLFDLFSVVPIMIHNYLANLFSYLLSFFPN